MHLPWGLTKFVPLLVCELVDRELWHGICTWYQGAQQTGMIGGNPLSLVVTHFVLDILYRDYGSILRGPKLGECCQRNRKFCHNCTDFEICPTVSQEKNCEIVKIWKKRMLDITEVILPRLPTLVWLDAIPVSYIYPHNFSSQFSSYGDSLRF